MNRDQALQEITKLAEEFQLSEGEILRYLDRTERTGDKRSTVLFQYLGGIFLFSAIGVFVGMYWSSLGDISRVLCTLGAGLVCYTLAWLYKSRQLSTVLFLMALPLEPTGMLIFIDSMLSLSLRYQMFASCLAFILVMIQFFIAYQHRKLPILFNGILLLSIPAYFYFISFVHLDWHKWSLEEVYPLAYGILLLLITYRARHNFHRMVVAEMWFSVACLFILISLHGLVVRTNFELIYPLAAVALVWLSLQVRSLLMTVLSVAALLFYIGEISNRWFEDMIAWPITLLFFGIACFWIQSLWAKRGQRL